MRFCAWVFFVAGFLGLIYALMMDTTAPVPGEPDVNGLPRRVHNIGLIDGGCKLYFAPFNRRSGSAVGRWLGSFAPARRW